MEILTEFDAEVKRSWFTIRKGVRATKGLGSLWAPARIGVDSSYVRVSSDQGEEEFRPNRLAWRKPNEFYLSGVSRRSLLVNMVLRFPTEEEAKRAASSIRMVSSVEEKPLSLHLQEIPADIIATVLVGRLFIALILIAIVLPLTLTFLRIPLIREVYGYLELVLFLAILIRIIDRQLKAGPAVAWFSPRRVKAWLSFEDDLFIVTTIGSSQGFSPSKVEWKDQTSFTVWEGETSFQLSFNNAVDAARVASTIKNSFPTAEEKSPLSSDQERYTSS